MKYQLIHQQLTLTLEQNAKHKAVLHFVLRGLAFGTVACRTRHFFQVIWMGLFANGFSQILAIQGRAVC
jgi:hypothetical protein